MASAPMNKIERAHQMYRDGLYEEALCFYTEGLAMAKTKAQKIALHSNRAACYLKLHNFKKAAEECTSVLEFDQKHTGALMLRAQTLVTLKEYHSALFDVSRLIDLNPSSEVYQNLQARLKTQLSLAPIPEADAELEEDGENKHEAKQLEDEEGEGASEKDAMVGINQNAEFEGATPKNEVNAPRTLESSQKPEKVITTPLIQNLKESSEQHSSGWQAIPKPKGHSHLDYSRWDTVDDDSSEDEDDEESQPHYRFRVRTVGVRAVK